MSTLYARHFRLKEAPFSIAPNPRFLFMSDQHREALAHLLYGIGHDGGFVLLTGEVGTGKTTLCRCLLEKVPGDADVAFIINPRLSVVDLLANICDELGISYDAEKLNNRLLVDAINHYLLERHAAGRHTVLVIDEAQNLDTDVLEQLRLLTNLETDEKKLLQIILLGQPELQDKLNTPELRQLSQRVTARYHLQALNYADMQAYIRHRLSVAGSDQAIFAPSALRFLHRQSKGIPRLINLICDRAMLGAFAQGVARIERSMIRQAAREVLGEQTATSSPGFRPGMAWAVAGMLLLAVASWSFGRWMTPQADPIAPLATSAPSANEAADVPVATRDTSLPERQAAEPVTQPGTVTVVASLQEPPAPATADDGAATTEALPAASEAAQAEAAAPAEPVAPISVPQTPTGAPPAPVEGGFLHDYHGAFRDLFSTWDIRLPDDIEPCDFASSKGLACQRISGDLGRLRLLDRPAVIDWHRDDGGMSYITVIALDGDSVRVVAGEKTFDLPLTQFRQHWLDRFTILWRTPPAYRSDIVPGTAGPSAKWLNQRLARLDGSAESDISGIYDGTWVPRLRRFQRDAGLLADGVAGAQTLIRLNTELNEPGPRLIRASQTAAVR